MCNAEGESLGLIPHTAHAGRGQRPPSTFSYTACVSRDHGPYWRTLAGQTSGAYCAQGMEPSSSLTGGLIRASCSSLDQPGYWRQGPRCGHGDIRTHCGTASCRPALQYVWELPQGGYMYVKTQGFFTQYGLAHTGFFPVELDSAQHPIPQGIRAYKFIIIKK